MLTNKIADISANPQITIQRNRNNCLSGHWTDTGKKRHSFRLSWGDDYAYLNLKEDNQELVKLISRALELPIIRSENRSLFGKTILYSWLKDQKERRHFYDGLEIAVSLNTGLFSAFRGWQEVRALKAL